MFKFVGIYRIVSTERLVDGEYVWDLMEREFDLESGEQALTVLESIAEVVSGEWKLHDIQQDEWYHYVTVELPQIKRAKAEAEAKAMGVTIHKYYRIKKAEQRYNDSLAEEERIKRQIKRLYEQLAQQEKTTEELKNKLY